jgi:chromosome segregation ATPase
MHARPSALEKVRRVIDAKDQAVTRDISEGSFDAAEQALAELNDLAEGIAGAGDIASDLVAQVRGIVVDGRSLLAKRRADSEETERLRSEAEEATRHAEEATRQAEEANRHAEEATQRAASEEEKSALLGEEKAVLTQHVSKIEETNREQREAAERLQSKVGRCRLIL